MSPLRLPFSAEMLSRPAWLLLPMPLLTWVKDEDGPLAGRARELNLRAAELAREAVGDDVLVAGSIGPSGQLIEPFGR